MTAIHTTLSRTDSLQIMQECMTLLQLDCDTENAPAVLLARIEDLIAAEQQLHECNYQNSKDLERLQSYLEQMIHDVRAVQRSRAWRFGFALMSLIKRAMGRTANGDGFVHIEALIERYQHWKKSRD